MLDSFISSLPDGASLLDDDMIIRSVNEDWRKIFADLKLSPDQVSPGSSYPEILQRLAFSEETVEKLEGKIENIIDGKIQKFKGEIRLEAGGGFRWYKVKISGFMGCVLVLKEDITVRKKEEKEREKLLKEHETIYENVQTALFLLDVEKEEEIKFQKFNPREEELTGLSTEDVQGKTAKEIFGAETGRKVEKDYRRCLETKEKMEYEEKLDFPGGTYIWHTTLAPVIIDGKVEKIVGAARDITARKREKLKTEALFENSTSAIAMLDSEGEIVDINKEFQEVFGYSMSDVKGEQLDSVMEWGKKGSSNRDKTRKLLRGNKIKDKGTRYDSQGTPVEFLCQGVPIIIGGEVEGAYVVYDEITELKREKEKLEAIFEASQNVAFVIGEMQDENADLVTIKEFSAGAENIFGYRRDEVIGRDVEILYSDESREKIDEIGRKVRNSKTWKGRVKLEDKEGGKFIAQHGVYPFQIGEERNLILGHAVDITELEETRKELEMTKFFLDNADMMIFRVTPEGEIIYANDHVSRKLGYTDEEIINMNVRDIIPGENFIERSKFWLQIKQSDSISYEKEFITSDEKIFPVNIVSQYFQYEGEEYEFVFARDITKRKEMEQKLRLKEEQYRKIFETAPVGILIQDEDGNILEVNEEICKMSNYSKDELEGCSVFNTLVPAEVEEDARENLRRILASEDLALTTKSRTKDGEVYYVRLEESRIKLPEGEEGVLTMHLDITELKKKEANLKYLSYHDGLTDLYNRSYLEEEMKRLDTERQLPISVIMCDVNGMKLVNDTYGHKKGDELLKRVADILRDCTRSEDIVSRWAGDEFVILLPQTGSDIVDEISRRIENASERAEFGDIPITLGLGTATKRNVQEKFENILSRADEKMYMDKLAKDKEAESKLLKNMLVALADKSTETNEHAMRMTELAYKLGEELDLPNEQLNRLTLLATLHDIGKITISEDILKKPEELSGEEWVKIKMHPEKGHTILTATDDFAHIAREVLHHHERWDGTGYPEGLAEKEIPLLSRIIAIVDAYDVMITGRPYKDSISKEKALAEIKACAGSQFDPELAEKFIKIMKESR